MSCHDMEVAGIASVSLRSRDAIPAELAADSASLGWRGVLARAYDGPVASAGFETPEGVDLLLVLATRGTYPVECWHAGAWRPLVVRPGSLAMTAPGERFGMRYPEAPGTVPGTFHVHLGHPLLGALAEDLSLPAPASLPETLPIDDAYVQAGMWALHDALSRSAPALHAEAVAFGIASQLLREATGMLAAFGSGEARTVALSGAQLERVRAYMLDHLAGEVTLDDLATIAHTSKFHFTRSFKAATGSTPLRYLTDLRMARAEDLLRGTSLSIAEVGARVGYTTSSGFGSAFRRHHGRTPTELRGR